MAEPRKRKRKAPQTAKPSKSSKAPKSQQVSESIKSGKSPRTAGGKRASPTVLANAEMNAQDGFRERTEAGHRAAGRTPPSQKSGARSAGAARIVDDVIRS